MNPNQKQLHFLLQPHSCNPSAGFPHRVNGLWDSWWLGVIASARLNDSGPGVRVYSLIREIRLQLRIVPGYSIIDHCCHLGHILAFCVRAINAGIAYHCSPSVCVLVKKDWRGLDKYMGKQTHPITLSAACFLLGWLSPNVTWNLLSCVNLREATTFLSSVPFYRSLFLKEFAGTVLW